MQVKNGQTRAELLPLDCYIIWDCTSVITGNNHSHNQNQYQDATALAYNYLHILILRMCFLQYFELSPVKLGIRQLLL